MEGDYFDWDTFRLLLSQKTKASGGKTNFSPTCLIFGTYLTVFWIRKIYPIVFTNHLIFHQLKYCQWSLLHLGIRFHILP